MRVRVRVCAITLLFFLLPCAVAGLCRCWGLCAVGYIELQVLPCTLYPVPLVAVGGLVCGLWLVPCLLVFYPCIKKDLEIT